MSCETENAKKILCNQRYSQLDALYLNNWYLSEYLYSNKKISTAYMRYCSES